MRLYNFIFWLLIIRPAIFFPQHTHWQPLELQLFILHYLSWASFINWHLRCSELAQAMLIWSLQLHFLQIILAPLLFFIRDLSSLNLPPLLSLRSFLLSPPLPLLLCFILFLLFFISLLLFFTPFLLWPLLLYSSQQLLLSPILPFLCSRSLCYLL